MLASSLLALVLGTGALAAPLAKPAEVALTTVVETLVYDTTGNLVDKKFKVGEPVLQKGAPEAPAPAPAPVAPVEHAKPQPAAPAPQPAPQPAAPVPVEAKAKPQPQTPSNPTPKQPGGGVSNVQSGSQDTGASDAAKTVGWLDSSDPRFAAVALWHHNAHRANHSAPDVVYDDTLAAAAQDWADQCIGDEKIPEGSGYGMNVAFSSTPDGYNPSQFISGGWYNSELGNFPGYGNANLPVDGNFMSWGHFSQVVWPTTQKIGCGISKKCGGGYQVHAGCMYYPAGNILGSFDKVKQPEGKPMVLPNGQNKM